jgi:1,2-diacylglycerol 3-alpha-glucosyltransferase
MNIGIITNSYPPNLNGVAVCVKNLEIALSKKGVKVFIVTPKVPNIDYPDNILPIPSYAVPTVMSKDLRLTMTYNDRKIRNFFQKNKVELIHSHDTIMGGLDAIIIGEKLKIPVVHTYHTFLEEYSYFNIIGYKLYIRNYSKFICDNSDSVIVLSDKIKLYLQDIGVKTNLISLPNIYVPKQIDESQLGKSNSFIEHNLIDHTDNIIIFGRVAKEKNIILSIEKLIPLFHLHPKLRFIILGDGPQSIEIQNYVIEHKLYNKVLFYGSYNHTDLANIAKYCLLYLNTSRTEVLPTTALEATSFSLPLLCINDKAFEYICHNGYNGFLITEDKITSIVNHLLENKEKISVLARNSKEVYDNYIRQDLSNLYIELYNTTIQNYKPIAIPKKIIKNLKLSLSDFIENFDLSKIDYFNKK